MKILKICKIVESEIVKAKILFFMALAVFGASVLFAAGNSAKKSRTLVVGSLNFTESILWGHMIAEMVRANSDIEVKLKENMGSTFVLFRAMESGAIDVYPDYTGAIYAAHLKKTKKVSAEESLAIVQREMSEKYQMKAFGPYGFNNTYAMGMLRSRAEELGIEKISDLAQYPDLIAGFDSEFVAREVDGAVPMFAAYGFEPANSIVQLEIGLRYTALVEGKVDYTDAYTTDAKLKRFDIKILEDDRAFFPHYYQLTVAREDTLQRLPELDGILRRLEGTANDEESLRLNFEVEENKRKPKDVALEFLQSKGLIP